MSESAIQPLDDMDFELRHGQILLSSLIVCLPFGILGAGVSYAYIDELLDAFRIAKLIEYVLVLGFWALLFALILGVVRSPLAQKFTEEGMWTRTWRGRRFVRWQEMTRATVMSTREGLRLVLESPTCTIAIPLSLYRRRRTLLEEIKRRLRFDIQVPEHLLPFI